MSGRKFYLLIFAMFFPFFAMASEAIPLVVVDAGHGGNDFGTRAKKPYCEEKRVALQTARLLRTYLTQLGYRVMMTRSIDVFVPLEKRADLANKASADLFVSIHFNSARIPKAKGIEIFFFESKENRKRTNASRNLARSILARLINRTRAVSRGVKKGNFYVLRETEMPAVIVEGGFISNPEELRLIKDNAYLEQIARGIADGVEAYFKKLGK
jgi:N-acetylmuramoyl-L-alanine amidase